MASPQILIDSAAFSPRAPVAPSCEKAPNCSLFGSFVVSDLFVPADDLAALFRASHRTKRAAVLLRRAAPNLADVLVCKGAVPVRRIGSIRLPWLAHLLDELLVTGHIDVSRSPPSSPTAAAAAPLYSYHLLLRAFTFGSLPAVGQFFRCKSDLYRQQCWLQLAAVCRIPSPSSVRVGCGVVVGGGVGGGVVGVPTTTTTTITTTTTTPPTTTTPTPTTTRIIAIDGAMLPAMPEAIQEDRDEERQLKQFPSAQDVVLGILADDDDKDTDNDNDTKKAATNNNKNNSNNNTDNCTRSETAGAQGIPCHGVGATAKPIDCWSSGVGHTQTTTTCRKRKAEVGVACEPVAVVATTAAATAAMFTTRLPASAGSSSTIGNLKQVTINGVPLVATSSFSAASSLLSNIASMPKPEFVRPLARVPKAKQAARRLCASTATTTTTVVDDCETQQQQHVTKQRRVGDCADDSAAALLVAMSAAAMAAN